MGWTFYPSRGRDTIDLLKAEFVSENQHGKWDWIDHAVRGSTVYALMRFTPKQTSIDATYIADTDGSYRFIVVFLTSRRGRDGYDFGYKDITESMGPCEKDCPTRLIKAASPIRTDDKSYARQWRTDCLAARAANRLANANRPKPGDIFRTNRPVKFTDGSEHSVFTCVTIQRRGRNVTAYRARSTGLLYRFSPAAIGFELCRDDFPSAESIAG